MTERRTEIRTRLNITGIILVDEHGTMPCIVSDRSASGIRLTLSCADELPDAFILTVDDTGEALVCRAAWRKSDQIGCTADALMTAWLAQPAVRRQPAWTKAT
jgi:hypothetical protein